MIEAVHLDLTARRILEVQRPDGSIPWWHGRHADPWNHIEAAMGLDVAGHHDSARAAYRWLRDVQQPDGSWFSAYKNGAVEDATMDANFCAYIAAGVWHHHLATGRPGFLEEMWRTVEDALDVVLGLQRVDGAIDWARDEHGKPWDGALLTSSSCIYLSLSSGIEIARALGCERPDWELSRETLREAVDGGAVFEDKSAFSMDLYYPSLAGALLPDDARARIEEGWDRFVIDGFGARCVDDRPWVTTGETCELVIACEAIGMRDEADALFEWVHHLRDDDGAYWTGATRPDGTVWPVEKTTWSAASVLLAADVLAGDSPTSGFFRIASDRSDAVVDPL